MWKSEGSRYTEQVKKFITSLTKPISLLAILLLLVTILRLPNFSEPYWYGDEGIYLTIGNSIRNGDKLYTDIVDHKTPIIYYLAAVDSQLQFRIVLYISMILATAAFFVLSQALFKKLLPTFIAGLIFVVFTSLPWFEGHIANGELFVITFVLLGAWLLLKTSMFKKYFDQKKTAAVILNKKDYYLLLSAGVFFGLSALTKVPAIFDIAGFGIVFFFMLVRGGWSNFKTIFQAALAFGLGILAPIFLSIIYFALRGSGQDYLDFGLLYNFHYAGTWVPSFSNAIVATLFTFKGKFMVMMVVIVSLFIFTKKISKPLQFATAWFVLALFATLLSNRPYPHYYLQTIPPLALLVGLAVNQLLEKKGKRELLEIVLPIASLTLFIGVLFALKVGLYETGSYYKNWLEFSRGKLSKTEYYQTFNYLMKDNYEAAKVIRSGSDEPSLFIWGTNPMLYALAKAVPPTRFTVSFHIADLNVYDQTIADVVEAKPKFIVVMNNEPNQLPGLGKLLSENYMINGNFDNYVLWKRINEPQGLLY